MDEERSWYWAIWEKRGKITMPNANGKGSSALEGRKQQGQRVRRKYLLKGEGRKWNLQKP